MAHIKRRGALSIFTVVLGSHLLVLLCLTALFSFALYNGAYRHHGQALKENHALRAKNLTQAVHAYLDKHITGLAGPALYIEQHPLDSASVQRALTDLLFRYPDLNSVSVYRAIPHAPPLFYHIATRAGRAHRLTPTDSLEPLFKCPSPRLSGITSSPLSGERGILIRYPLNPAGLTQVYLLGELTSAPIEALRSAIGLAKGGYGAIVDHRNQLVAHPQNAWAGAMRDVSQWSIVQAQRANGQGIGEFYSPFVKQTLVAAYATVPEYDWGIFIAQPQGELERYVRHVSTHLLIGFALGLIFTLIIARRLSAWITRPLHALSSHAQDLADEQNACRLQLSTTLHSPLEINQLCDSLNAVLSNLRGSLNRQKACKQQILYIVEHSPLLFAVCDFDARLSYAAGRMLSKFGLTPEKAIGQHLSRLFPPELCNDAVIERLREGQKFVHTVKLNETVLELWCASMENLEAPGEQFMIVGTDISDSHIAAVNAKLLDENRRLNENLIRAEESERHRIAGELHDLFGQDLTGIRNYTFLIRDRLSQCSPQCAAAEPVSLKEYTGEIEHLAAGLQDVLRSLLERLWPEALDNVGLVGAIQDLVDSFKRQHPGVDVDTQFSTPTLKPTDEQAIYIYRIFSECLTNIARHANATRVTIAMSLTDDGQLRLRIQDDGLGFDPAQVPSDRHGLSAMRERVRVLRATCTLQSACGEGTSVTISIPFQPFTP